MNYNASIERLVKAMDEINDVLMDAQWFIPEEEKLESDLQKAFDLLSKSIGRLNAKVK
jgi:hypothetical protein